MQKIIHALSARRAPIILTALALALWATATLSVAASSGERVVNGSFEEGFGDNGVGQFWVGFNNGGTVDYHYQDDLSPAFNYDGNHSQLIEISTVKYAVSEQDRYTGIYQTLAVVAGQAYTLTLRGELRVLSTDLDMNNWAYVVQYAVDQNGGTDWGKVDWQTLPWQNTYDWQKPGPLATFSTTITATSNKLTLFIRALKKFPTPYRDLFVNLDGVSLVGALPTSDQPTQITITPPTFVYTTKPFPVHISASSQVGLTQVKLFDEDKLIGSVSNAVGPLTREIDLAWTPTLTGTRALRAEATDAMGKTTPVTATVVVAAITDFIKNGDFEGGFTPDGTALQWARFDNGGRNVTDQLYDDTWSAVVSSGKHSQLIEISSVGEGYYDPYQEPDRYLGICQVVSGLTPHASYYVSGKGAIRITTGDQHTDDWSWAAQWGYQVGEDPTCAKWNQVQNWFVLPWSNVGYRENIPQVQSFSQVFDAPSSTLTIYFRGWKKWAVGAREFLVNFDDFSLAGYK